MTFLAMKDFLELAWIGAVREKGLFAPFQGDPSGDGAISTGEGAAAGGDGIIVVLNGFPSFLHRNCGYVNMNKRSGSKVTNSFDPKAIGKTTKPRKYS